jgi:signal peptidase I
MPMTAFLRTSRTAKFVRRLTKVDGGLGKLVTDVVMMACTFHCVTLYGVNFTACLGPSMLPTIQNKGDWLLIDMLSYKLLGEKYKIGDVVICEDPKRSGESPPRTVCKRIFATGGEVVYISEVPELRTPDNTVSYVTTVSKKEPSLSHHSKDPSSLIEKIYGIQNNQSVDLDDYVNPYYKRVKIPVGHVWLAGDNKYNSLDSRY